MYSYTQPLNANSHTATLLKPTNSLCTATNILVFSPPYAIPHSPFPIPSFSENWRRIIHLIEPVCQLLNVSLLLFDVREGEAEALPAVIRHSGVTLYYDLWGSLWNQVDLLQQVDRSDGTETLWAGDKEKVPVKCFTSALSNPVFRGSWSLQNFVPIVQRFFFFFLLTSTYQSQKQVVKEPMAKKMAT